MRESQRWREMGKEGGREGEEKAWTSSGRRDFQGSGLGRGGVGGMGEGVRGEQGGRMGTHEKNLNTLSRRLSRKSRRILITRMISVSPPMPPVVSPSRSHRCTDNSAGRGAAPG